MAAIATTIITCRIEIRTRRDCARMNSKICWSVQSTLGISLRSRKWLRMKNRKGIWSNNGSAIAGTRSRFKPLSKAANCRSSPWPESQN